MMKVILREDVPHLGVVGDLVTVKDGYGRNYLVPQRKAILASPRSVRELDHQKRLAAHHREKATAEARTQKDKIEGLAVCITAKVAPPPVDDSGEPITEVLQKLFGSVTNRDLAKVLRQSGFKVEHRRVTMETSVRSVGKFTAAVRLDGGVIATLPFWVVPEGAADIEAEKTRVEAAQVAMVQADADAAAAEAARWAAPITPMPVDDDAGDGDAQADDSDDFGGEAGSDD